MSASLTSTAVGISLKQIILLIIQYLILITLLVTMYYIYKKAHTHKAHEEFIQVQVQRV